MPAKSQDQQQAAGIALQAKREGTVDELPSGSASKEMAKSMTKKELEKLAGTKHKGLPKDIDESKTWAGSSLVAVFKEEMQGVSDQDDEEEQITTQKSKVERLNDREIGTGKGTEDTWTSTAGGTAPAIANNARSPMTSNTAGARVAEQVKLSTGKETCPACDGTGLKDGRDNRPAPMWQPDLCPVCLGKGEVETGKELEEIHASNKINETINLSRWQQLAGLKVVSELLTEKKEKRVQKAVDSKAGQAKPNKAAKSVAKESTSFEEVLKSLFKEGTTTEQRYFDTNQDEIGEGRNPNSLDIVFEMDTAQAKNYVSRLAKHGWSWDKVAEQLKNQYGVRPYEIDKVLFPHWKEVTGQ